MPQQNAQEATPWTPEEDDFLRACWPNPNLDYPAISRLMLGKRTAGAIQHRGSKIGLGRKARHKKVRKPTKKSMAWPADMPNFEDHPKARPSGSLAKAAKLGAQVQSISRNSEISHTGSSLAGGSINSSGRRI